ncbi:IS4 family transposase [Rhodanobacter sp. FW106-PBR-R2A-1-13]|uniref:IS4 family transposase n=1 Tax=Rhodanobacter sp. FW106-PBR-R2A-1-13 TaxID=3454845 RepID=UPI0009DC45F6|nr:MAG: IS4 family transposase [Rhodanobacter sp.]
MVFHEPLALTTTLQAQLDAVGELSAEAFDRFSQLIPAAWIEQALQATGTASLRRRRLPAERLIWLVIGLALFRNEPIWHIVRQLGLALGTEAQVVPVPSAAAQGRQRLGEAPLAHLFDQISRAWCTTPLPAAGRFQGLRLLAVDGVVWSTPDTAGHREVFGGGRSQHGDGSWPQVRAVCLMEVHTHLIRAAAFGAYTTGELSYAQNLMAAAPDESLTIFDRAYYSAAFLLAWQRAGKQRHWLMRAKSSLRYEVLHPLGEGDAWVRLPVSPQARRQHPELPAFWEARLIVCSSGRRYLTSLADPARYPAEQVATCYRERWEIELGFRDIKQGMQANDTVLRSKRPELVRQEIWGLLIAYNLLRWEMHQTADALGVPPARLSFQGFTRAIVAELRHAPLETPGAFPKRLARLRQQARVYLLPPRRRRSCPREVKRRPHKYPTKNASQLN